MTTNRYPEHLLYHPEHGWADVTGDHATFGITWHAQNELQEVVFFDPPAVGAIVTAGEPYAELESAKTVADVIAPLSGQIIAVNTKLVTAPAAINDDPHHHGWMVKVQLTAPAELEALMNAATYDNAVQM